MRIFLFTLSLFFIASNIQAQNAHEIEFKHKIDEITVFLNGGEIRRSETLNLRQGRNRIVFKDLSQYIQASSIQTSIAGDLHILSVSSEYDYLNREILEPRIKVLSDSVTMLEENVELVNNEIDAYNAEKKVLSNNIKIGGNQIGVTVYNLQQSADFHRERTLKINNELTRLNKKKNTINSLLTKLRSQLQELNYKNNPTRTNIVIVVNAERAMTTKVNLRYIVTNTAWFPTYDLIAEDVGKPIQLKYRAKVQNNTGINWKNVDLTLSTADPFQGATQPYLTPWTLDFNEPITANLYKGNYRGGTGYENAVYVGDLDKAAEKYDGDFTGLGNTSGQGAASFETVVVDELSAEFPIDRKHDIPADAKPYQVDIDEFELKNVDYEHIAVPKMDRDAFLLAKISGWEKLDLIDGDANIYFGDTYIGISRISTRFVEDTLDISLGRDKQVLVTRVKREDFTSKKILGGNKKEYFKYEIVVKNNRQVPISLELQDQVPVSLESDIVVDVINVSNAEHDEQSGKLTWDVQLEPGESQKYTLEFSVKYPKNREVTIKRSRVLYSPRF